MWPSPLTPLSVLDDRTDLLHHLVVRNDPARAQVGQTFLNAFDGRQLVRDIPGDCLPG